MIDSNPLISVITICYQSEEFIEQCIESVVSQTCDDFEYIIIDGGSTDGTVEVIKKYKDKLSYWHSKSDRGLSHAFNLGLEQCKGQWIAFLNSDDMYVNNFVLSEIASNVKGLQNYDVVHGRIQHIERQKKPIIISSEIGGLWQWRNFRRYSSIPHPAAVISKHLVDEVGLFDENYRNALDYEFFLRKGAKLNVLYLPKLFTQMRLGGISTLEVARSLRESREAQVKNSANHIVVAYFWWAYFRMRVIVKQWLRIF